MLVVVAVPLPPLGGFRCRLRFRRRNPDSGEDGCEPDHQIERDRLAHKLAGEQRRCNGIDRHGVGHARGRRPLQGHDPENERKRATANTEIDAGDPLRSPKARQDGDATGHETRDDEHHRTTAHADCQKS